MLIGKVSYAHRKGFLLEQGRLPICALDEHSFSKTCNKHSMQRKGRFFKGHLALRQTCDAQNESVYQQYSRLG